MKNNKLCNKISTAESVNGSRPVLQQRNVLKREMSTDGLDSERNGCWKEEKTVEEKDGGLNWGGDNSPCLCSPLLYAKKKKGGVAFVFKARAHSTLPFALSALSAVYIKSPSRSRCQPIKYIHFPGFYSAAHLLNIYEWRLLNSFQFTFKAGFIGTTDV